MQRITDKVLRHSAAVSVRTVEDSASRERDQMNTLVMNAQGGASTGAGIGGGATAPPMSFETLNPMQVN